MAASFSITTLLVICTTFVGFAQTLQSEPPQDSPHASTSTGTEKQQLTQQFLNDKLARWQQRLELQDWRISVVMTQRDALPPKTMGGIRWDKVKKTAVIWVLDPSEYRVPFPAILNDMELTIVHELIHLDLASLPRGQASRSSEEHAVDSIAHAMLELDRELQ